MLLNKFNISKLLDAPCGDFNWFQHVTLRADISYVGGDIVDEMISSLNFNWGTSLRTFTVLDVVHDTLPSVDLWLCRDLIFHLTNDEIFKVLNNFVNSDIHYLLITSHLGDQVSNVDTFAGGFRRVNLMLPPFTLPEPEFYIKDYIDGWPERGLFLYRHDTLNSWQQRAN